MKTFALFLLLSSAAHGGDLWTYWIEPCSQNCKPGDPELARWAIEAWQRASNGAIQARPFGKEAEARLRIHWVSGRSQLYGETRGGDVYVLPSAAKPSGDPLDRDTVVYLTCLHEIGHALGLPHTANFADIMYSFQYGGDIPEYFARFRRQLKTRADIAKTNAISEVDRAALIGKP